jgi:FkbM family methyltransferase
MDTGKDDAMGWEISRAWKLLLPHKLAGAAYRLAKIIGEFPKDARALGIGPAWILLWVDLEHWLRRVFQRNELDRAPRDLVKLQLKGYSHPLWIRRNSSDRFVVRQVFRNGEYGSIDLAGPIRRFVDAGSNIGCASFYLLHRYPESEGDAIEADPENLALCQKNLEPFRGRVRIHRRGVWPRSMPLRLVKPDGGLGLETTTSVVECSPGEAGDIEGVSLDDLRMSGSQDTFDLVKMDIEGAELPILEAHPRWLDSTRNLMIELHGPEARRAFDRALMGYRSTRIAEVGDITICTGIERL